MSVALLMPGLVARLEVDELALEAAALGPAQVHAQQHLGPVLRLGAAGAGVNRDDRVLAVVLAAEHLLGLAGVDLRRQLVERAPEVVGDRLPRFGPFDQDVQDRRACAAASRAAGRPLRAGGGAAGASARPPGPSRSPASETRSSILASSSAGRAASKIAPQVAGAARQVLVPAKLIVVGHGREMLNAEC